MLDVSYIKTTLYSSHTLHCYVIKCHDSVKWGGKSTEMRNQIPGKELSGEDVRRGRLCGLSSSSASELHGDSYGVLTRFKDARPSVFGDDDKLMMESGEPLFRCISTWPKSVDGRKGPSPVSSLRWTAYEIVIRRGTKRLTSCRRFHYQPHLRHLHRINVYLARRTSCEARHAGEQPA